MKKVLLSLTSAVLLLTSCSNDENVLNNPTGTGEVVTTLAFDGITNKNSVSKAIPITGWDNVKQVQMLLYRLMVQLLTPVLCNQLHLMRHSLGMMFLRVHILLLL